MSEHMPEKICQNSVSGWSLEQSNFLCFSGWWFGSWLLFFHILGIIIPTDFHICQRGRSTTNQLCFYMSLKWRFTMGCFIPWSGVYLRVFFLEGFISRHWRGAVAMGDFRTQWFNGSVFLSSFDCTTGKLQYQVYQVMIFHRWNIWKQRFDMSHVEIPRRLGGPGGGLCRWSRVGHGATWSGFLWAHWFTLAGDLWDALPMVPEIFGGGKAEPWDFFNSDFEAKHGEMWS